MTSSCSLVLEWIEYRSRRESKEERFVGARVSQYFFVSFVRDEETAVGRKRKIRNKEKKRNKKKIMKRTLIES